MKFTKLAILASAITLLSACGPDEVPQDIVDTNMTTSRINAQKNADSYFAVIYPANTTDPKLGNPIRALMQSDSTISKSCRYGDGWATGNIQYDGGKLLSIKCQTNGTGKGINGCMTAEEFSKKTFKDEDGKCQNLSALEKFK